MNQRGLRPAERRAGGRRSGGLTSGLLRVIVLSATVLVVRVGTETATRVRQAPSDGGVVRVVPPDLQDVSWLQRLRDAQVKATAATAVFHDFQFTDKVLDSRITFKHQIVDDAGKTYKAAHYDHGNGIAIADVDGDGRPDIYFVSQIGGNGLWRNSGSGKFEDITASAEILTGSPAVALLDAIAPADLVVMTTHGRSGVRRWLLGSVADKLIREANAPILLVRADSPLRTSPRPSSPATGWS